MRRGALLLRRWIEEQKVHLKETQSYHLFWHRNELIILHQVVEVPVDLSLKGTQSFKCVEGLKMWSKSIWEMPGHSFRKILSKESREIVPSPSVSYFRKTSFIFFTDIKGSPKSMAQHAATLEAETARAFREERTASEHLDAAPAGGLAPHRMQSHFQHY